MAPTTPPPAPPPAPASDPHPAQAIRVRGLRRSYGSGADAFDAVRGVDLDVARGSIVALLGTNGAGKTSTLEVIEGLAPATAGEVRVLGLDPVRDRARVRRRVGVLLQESGFSGDLTVAETLRMWSATVTGARPVEQLLDLLDLDGRADVRVRALSGGERRRLDLACTLTGSPELVLLDEPTTGLDPESRRSVWRLLRELRAQGATVLLSTHYLEEAEALADRIAIMHEGLVVRDGTPAQLAAEQPATVSFRTPEAPLPAVHGRMLVEDGATVIETDDLQRSLAELLRWAEGAGVRLEGLAASSASLEAVFLAVAAGPHQRPPATGPAAADEPLLEGSPR